VKAETVLAGYSTQESL